MSGDSQQNTAFNRVHQFQLRQRSNLRVLEAVGRPQTFMQYRGHSGRRPLPRRQKLLCCLQASVEADSFLPLLRGEIAIAG